MLGYISIMETELIRLLVPDYILEYFDYDKVEELSGVIRIHLLEKKCPNQIPKEIIGKGKAVLDGYMNPLELQTYPTKGKEVFLLLNRRRWKIRGSNKGYHNTYKFHQQGMKATKEFGVFLKEIGRE